MKNEVAYGVIPLAKKGGVWNVLLVKHSKGGYWCFPKGHSTEGESHRETAIRELKEETGLNIKQFISSEAFVERYSFERNGKDIEKTVSYYVAEVFGDVCLQEEEISDGKWVPLFEASSHVTFPEAQSLCRQVYSLFSKG